ncbi:MAG: hypothetical protein AAGI38_06940 [Bacteroidota bacterium]
MKKIYFNLFLFFLVIAALFTSHCESNEQAFDVGTDGIGGSLARFAVSNNHLYTVDGESLNIFDLSQPDRPELVGNVFVGTAIETIFPRDSFLFIGSRLGIYIYSVSEPASPIQLSQVTHVFSCDPVVADDSFAYVTLRSIENVCGQFTNQLDIIDIKDKRNPFIQITYPMTSPQGLGIDKNRLFVCDEGLKMFDATNVDSLVQLDYLNIQVSDVIPLDGNVMVIGDDGFAQYSYLRDSLSLLSVIPVE